MDWQTQLRQAARKLLEDKQVDVVIGYEATDEPLRTTPCFIRDPKEADRLVWNPFCEHNLAGYLQGRQDKAAVVAKGCDSRAMVVLINENQVQRKNITVIGVPCGSIVDRKKIYRHLKGADIRDAVWEGDVITVKGPGFSEELKVEDFLAECCKFCRHRNPVLCDIKIGEDVPEVKVKGEYNEVMELEGSSSEDRWEFFKKELSKCVRCYACREACPLCYCKQCFTDQSLPAWIGKTTDISDTMAFQIMRAYHTTGRCVDCGNCERACPNDVQIRLLTKKIEKDVKELFGSEAGLKIDEKTSMTVYNENDPQDFIK